MKTWVGLAVVGDSVTPQTIDAENLEDASRQCSEWVTSVGGQFLGVQLVDVSRATGVSKLVELGLAPEEAMAVGGFSPDYLTAQGVFPGQEWRQPITPADSYPLDWEVTWNGKTWKSTVPFNVWEPGVAAWTGSGKRRPARGWPCRSCCVPPTSTTFAGRGSRCSQVWRWPRQ